MPRCDSCGLRGQEVWVIQPVGDRMRSPMLFLHCFPELLATRGMEARGPGKEFQGEPRDTGRPKPSLLALMAHRPLLPSAANVGSASSQKQQPLLPPHASSWGPTLSVGSSLRGPLDVQASKDQTDFLSCE